jgi:chemotaxis methyl-accepting protein methylase
MNKNQAVQELDDLLGEGWFEKVIEGNEKLGLLTLEEQISWVRNCSIHGQTSFFRDPFLLPILEHIAIPSFDRRPVRIASVGCSDGREIYSILISCWKKISELVLHGYDSNPDLVEEARAGGEGMRLGPKGRRDSNYSETHYILDKWKHFGAEGIAYTLTQSWEHSWADLTFTEEAKKKVRFEVHNIANEPLPEKYDVIVLLNVLCHYTQKGREAILGNVDLSLEDDGWLICEKYDPGSANAVKEYDEWMKNPSKFGFTKQATVIPTWASKNDDVSNWSRAYRKNG